MLKKLCDVQWTLEWRNDWNKVSWCCFLRKWIVVAGWDWKDLVLYELEEAFEYITPSLHNEYVPLLLQIQDNENDPHSSASIPLDQGVKGI